MPPPISQQDFLRQAMATLDMTRDAFVIRFGMTRRALDTWLLPSESDGFRPMPEVAGRYVAEVLWLFEHQRLTYTRSVHIIPSYLDTEGVEMQTQLDPMAVSFRGTRTRDGTSVEIVVDGVARPLPYHLAVGNHSPLGFEWGYPGSGPAQLALAMCVELIGPVDAVPVYQHVKDRLITGLQEKKWAIRGNEVMEVIWEHADAAGQGN